MSSMLILKHIISVYTGLLILFHTVFAHDHHLSSTQEQIIACNHRVSVTTLFSHLELFLHQDLGPGHFDYDPGFYPHYSIDGNGISSSYVLILYTKHLSSPRSYALIFSTTISNNSSSPRAPPGLVS